MRTVLVFLLTSVALSTADAARVAAKAGDRFYTQFSLFHEGGQHVATNYRRGTLLPINTEVEFVKSTRTKIIVRVLNSDKKITVANVEKYSGVKIDGLFGQTFGKARVPLDAYSEREQRNIRKGMIAIGMSRQAVLRALGYPPAHKTPSLESKTWIYWRHRFGTYVVTFDGDKVMNVKPPHHLDATP
jgi:hypothetical protein